MGGGDGGGLTIYVGRRKHLPTLYYESYNRGMGGLVVGARGDKEASLSSWCRVAEIACGLGCIWAFGFFASRASEGASGRGRRRWVGSRRSLGEFGDFIVGSVGRVLGFYVGGGVVGIALVVGCGCCRGQFQCWKIQDGRARLLMLSGLLILQGHGSGSRL